jgi:AraC-like DNA-binding protein
LIQVTDTLEGLGISAERMLKQAKLPYALMHQAARSLGNPTFGLLVGTANGISTMGSFGKLIANSLTIYHAFETSSRLMPMFTSDAHYWMTEAGDEVWRCRRLVRGPTAGRRHMEQFNLMRVINQVCMGAGPSWRPAKVCLQTREAPEPELREALGDPEIRVGQNFTGIAVPRALLVRPMRRRGMPPRDGEEAEARLRHTAPVSSFVDSLRQLAGTLLKEGPPQIETMAEITGVPVRTLQRHLAKSGLSHTQLVDQARYQAAARLLEDADIRITDIAMELNYADSANFTRAFKRWAGITPREYRRQQQLQ